MSKAENKSISQIVRKRLLIMAVLAFFISLCAFWVLHTTMANRNAKKILEINIQDVYEDILAQSDRVMLNLAEQAAISISDEDEILEVPSVLTAFEDWGLVDEDNHQNFINYLCLYYELSEINIIDKNGIIVRSTNPNNLNFDMRGGTQSSAFMCLVDGEADTFVQEYLPLSRDASIKMKYAGKVLPAGGFVQIGIDGEQYHDLIESKVLAATENRHVGESGSLIIIRDSGEIVSSHLPQLQGKNISELGYDFNVLTQATPMKMYVDSIKGVKYNFMVSSAEGYSIIGLLPVSEEMVTRNATLAMVTILESIIFVTLFILIYALTQKQIVKKVQDVAGSLDEIAAGNLDVVVDVKGNKEFASLSRGINQTVDTLKQHIENEKTRLSADLEYAKEIQHSTLPSVFPPFPDHKEFEIYASMDPAKEVGGDYYDFDIINGRFLMFSVADVSGKGIPAALIMMRAKTMVKSYVNATIKIDNLLERVNNELCRNNEAGMFVTCWLGLMDTQTGIVSYVNAGHNPPVVKHADGSFEYLREYKPNFVLGGMENVKYKEHQFHLDAGDEIFIYTDGVTEATDAGGKLYGEDRLLAFLNNNNSLACKDKCVELRKNIDEFVGDAPQFDDITMMSIKYRGFDNTFKTDADQSNYNAIMEFIDRKLEELECPMPIAMKINVAADEVIANIMSYAYGSGNGKMAVVVDKCEEKDGVELRFIDWGVPFNPLEAEDPDISLNAEERKIGGLGIFMVKKMMDKVEYEYSSSNNLVLTKYF